MAKRKKKKKFRIKLIPVLILIVVVAIVFTFMHFNSKTYLFNKAFNKTIKIKEEMYKESKSKYLPFMDENYYLETNTTFNYNENKNKYTGKIYIDGNDNYYDLNIKKNNLDKQIIFINKDGKSYYKLKDTFYYVPSDTNTDFTEEEISKVFTNNIKKYIKKGRLAKKNEVINYDKAYKTKKLTLYLSKKEFYNLMIDTLSDKSIKSISSDSKKMINELKDKRDKEKNVSNYFAYSIYTYKGTPVLEEYEVEKEGFKMSSFYHDDYKHTKFKTKESKKESYIIEDNGKIDLFMDGYFYGKGSIKDDSIEITFTDYDKKEIGSLSYKIENTNNIYNVTFKMNTNLDSLKLDIDMTNTIDTSKSIPSIDLKGAKSIVNASEEELEMFTELLTN